MEYKGSGFTSYIDEKEFSAISLTDEQKTKFLDGETIVCESSNVLLFQPLSDKKRFTTGVLTVTTFKVSFASSTEDKDTETCCQQNYLLGLNDVCLSSIDVIYQLGDRSKKKLLPGQSITGKVKELLIVCKNMRTMEFSFKLSDKDAGKNVANAILHHTYPKRHALLFAYDYKEPYMAATLLKEVCLFRSSEDWKRELKRTKCREWRVSSLNQSFEASVSMMSTLIVPSSLNDATLQRAIEHFRNRFCPVWVWGNAQGAALVRMADLMPTITDRTQENLLLEHIRRSHPRKDEPYIVDLTRDCPLPKDVQSSYLKLRELCVPDNSRTFKNQDFKFYGLLDHTKWMGYVSVCLKKAVETVEQIECGRIVVLQECDGHDLNCIVSSLAQLMLDAHYRTKYGFQSLIQKEWVAMGHPFNNRLGHILSKETEQSPVFLLFLDCVWQLLQQFPAAFQVSETYLTSVWDSAHISVFETFLFNNEHDRMMAQKQNMILRSVWNWKEQFSDKDIALFCNPLYKDDMKMVLRPATNVCNLDIWLQCYFRWLPDLEICRGGRPQIDLCSRFIVREIWQLNENSEQMNGSTKNNSSKEEYLEMLKRINSFFPFSRNKGEVTDMLSNVLLSGDLLDTQSILNLNND